MGVTLITIQQGDSIVAEQPLVFLGTGSVGDPGAARRLVWPSGVSPLLAPIVYQVDSSGVTLNPARTLNLDKAVLPHPRTAAVQTLGTTQVVRFERTIEDVIVTEVWPAEAGSSMPSSLFRLLYEYLANAALIGADDDPITWEPRDRSDKVYAVELLSLSAGGEDDETRFDLVDARERPPAGTVLDDALASLSPLPTGLITTEVRLRFRIVAEV